MRLSRRRFVQLFGAGSSQLERALQWSWQLVAGGFVVACRSIGGLFVKSRRWVFPSTVGDFVIETRSDLRKVTEFSTLLFAERIEFPSVAATMLEPAKAAPDNDTDQVVLHDVWLDIIADPGTQLFREDDIVRSGTPRSKATGDFTIAFDPLKLFQAFGDEVPLAPYFDRNSRALWTAEREREKLLRFRFCVKPETCQASDVRSMLPVVTATWPRFDMLLRAETSEGSGAIRLRPTGNLIPVTADLNDCALEKATPMHALRWLEGTFEIPQKYQSVELTLPMRQMNGRIDSVVLRPGAALKIRIRPAFLDLLLDNADLRSTAGGGMSVALKRSHFHVGKHFGYAWLNDMPVEPTPLAPEIAWQYCLHAEGASDWPLAPRRISIPRLASAIDIRVQSQDVLAARVSTRIRGGKPTRWVEQQFESFTIAFTAKGSALDPVIAVKTGKAPGQLRGELLIIDGDARLRTSNAAVSSNQLVLVEDLFVKPDGTAPELEIRYREDRFEIKTPSRFIFPISQYAWAGLYDKKEFERSWIHIKPVDFKDSDLGTGDKRADAVSTEKATVDWNPATGGFQLIDKSKIKGKAEIVSIAEKAFRAAIPDDFPRRDEAQPMFLAPFALREHKDFDFGRWVDPQEPAFLDDTMWEPRTEARFSISSDSPADLFSAFAAEDAAGETNGHYAGFAFTGNIEPLPLLDWAPNPANPKDLAPYRGIRGNTLRPILRAEDVSDLDDTTVHPAIAQAFLRTDPREASLQREFKAGHTEIAFSPIGGSIGFHWTTPIEKLGLEQLFLRGFLGRYQKNYAIVKDLLLPYGILIHVLALVARETNGKLRYCTKWWFAEPSKSYGDDASIIIDNLRPLNAVNFNPKQPLRFKADFHYRSSDGRWTDADRTLQGAGLITVTHGGSREAIAAARHQTVALNEPQPLTLFKETPLRLAQTAWDAEWENVAATTGCTTPVHIAVKSSGELERVEGMNFDSRDIDVTSEGRVSADTGQWCEAGRDHDPVYHTTAVTLGDGVVRVHQPLDNERFHLDAGITHTFVKRITLRDVALLQLILGSSDDEFLKNEGTLTIKQQMKLEAGSDVRGGTKVLARVESTVDFPDFSRGRSEICEQELGFRIATAPRSFHAGFLQDFGARPKFDATLKADVGIPGFLLLKDCTITSRAGNAVEFKPGNLSICGELLRKVFEALLEMAKAKAGIGGGGDSPFSFEFLDGLKGFLVKLRLPLPRVPMGAGSIDHLTFDLRLALSLDFSGGGLNAGALMTFILGDFNFPGFGGIPWLKLDLPTVARRIFTRTDRPTIFVTPFVIRFGVVIAVRVRPPKSLTSGFEVVCFDAVACVSGEAGLGVAFDVGVAWGHISITIGIVWCPNATYEFNTTNLKGNAYFSFDEVSFLARIEAYASVLGLVNITVYVEIMANLRLTCPKGVVSHMEVNGTAHIEMLFVEIDQDFHVDLDPILGIDPNACKHDGADATRVCVIADGAVRRLAHETARGFFAPAELLEVVA